MYNDTNFDTPTVVPPPKPPRAVIRRELFKIEDDTKHRTLSDRENVTVISKSVHLSEDKSREELIETIATLQSKLEAEKQKVDELEDYIASLLLKVMTNAPDVLQADLNKNTRMGN